MFKCIFKSPLRQLIGTRQQGNSSEDQYFAELTFIAGEVGDDHGFSYDHSVDPFYDVGTFVSSNPTDLLPAAYVDRWLSVSQWTDEEQVIIALSGSVGAMGEIITLANDEGVDISLYKGDDLLVTVPATILEYGPGYLTFYSGDPDPILVPIVLGDTYTVKFKIVNR